jgi:hypothetical protein
MREVDYRILAQRMRAMLNAARSYFQGVVRS